MTFVEYKNKILKSLKLDRIIKDKYDEIFLLIFLFSLGIGIYFFTKTYSQAVWFDEADYLNFGKYLAFGFPEWGLGAVRPPLFPLITGLFFKLGLGEIGLRVLILLFGLSNVFLIYLISNEITEDKRVGLISAMVSATFGSFLFYSSRLLVDIPVLTLWLLATYLFLRGSVNKKSILCTKLLVPILFLGFLMKYLNAFLVILIVIYLIITERFSFIKNRNLQISTLIGIVMSIPFFIYQYISYGSPITFLTASLGNRTILGRSFIEFLKLHIQQLFPMIGIVLLLISIIGLIKILEIFLGLDLIVKNKDNKLSKELFLFVWFIGTLLFVSKLGYGYYFEERLAFNFFAALFIITGIGAIFIYDTIKKYIPKSLAAIIILSLILFGVYNNLMQADTMITGKSESFIQVKQAGQFLEQNLAKDEGYLSPATSAEIQYHSNRKNMGSDVVAALNNSKIKYAVFSGFNPMPNDYTNFIQNHTQNFKPVAVYYLDEQKKQPIVVIFEIMRN